MSTLTKYDYQNFGKNWLLIAVAMLFLSACSIKDHSIDLGTEILGEEEKPSKEDCEVEAGEDMADYVKPVPVANREQVEEGEDAQKAEVKQQLKESAISEGNEEVPGNYIVYFDFDRAAIDADGKDVLNVIARDLRDQKNYLIMINGHTDTAGDDDYNLSLSHNRANSAKAYLVAFGADRKKIEVFGFGESDPARETPNNVREPANRRAEIVVELMEEEGAEPLIAPEQIEKPADEVVE